MTRSYRPTAFLAMTRDKGGLTAARALLDPKTARSLAMRAARLIYRGWKPHDRVPGALVQQPCATDVVPATSSSVEFRDSCLR